MSREEIVKPLIAAGWTRQRALDTYRFNLRRYQRRRFVLMEKQGIVVDSGINFSGKPKW